MENRELCHYGVKGMKWGVRRYQDENGRLTAAGRKRYVDDKTKWAQRDIDSLSPYRKTGIKTKNGKVVMTAKDVNDEIAGLEKQKQRDAAKAGKKYDKAVAKDDKKAAKYLQKQYGNLEDAMTYKKDVSEKDLMKSYNKMEDIMTSSRYANKKVQGYTEKALDEIDRQLSQTGKHKTYDMTKVNSYIEQALSAIDEELSKR